MWKNYDRYYANLVVYETVDKANDERFLVIGTNGRICLSKEDWEEFKKEVDQLYESQRIS
jgi:hypothetical protein